MSQDFHKHLDKCPQCKNHPFNLCSKGERILFTETVKIVDVFQTVLKKKVKHHGQTKMDR